MKKILFLALSSLFFSNTFSQEVKLSFDYPQIIKNGEYIELIYEDLQDVTSPGNPIIPYINYSILEKQNHASKDIVITKIEYYDEVIEGKLLPASTPIPLSSEDKTLIREENKDIYSSSAKYPENNLRSAGTHYLAGHGITSINIYAAEFYPTDNYIKLVKSVTFENISEYKKSELPAFENKSTINNINCIVNDNSALKSYSYSATKNGEEIDFLVITSEEFVEQMQEYMLFKNKQGYFTAIETTEYIYQNYDGVDEQEKIRNCVKDYYNNFGLQYLLLVGDADTKSATQNIVPCRGFTALYDPCIPADMYYSNLDGSWNTNNNHLWGEWYEIDYYAEISVGRLCIDSSEELNNFLNKLMLYQDSPVVEDVEKALMIGESLDSYTWGGDYKDEIVTGTFKHGFITRGIPNNIEVSRLYERDQQWRFPDLKKAYNQTGVNIINHLGHSSVDYNMKIYGSSVTTKNFTNDGITRSFAIHYSQGCYNGSMDNRDTGNNSYGTTDCFAETISTLPTGNVACLANSRYGWYSPGGTSSSSQFYDRLFFDGIYNEYPKVGDANRYSKEKFISWLDESDYFRWTAYEMNLFGDPSMDVWTVKPTEIATNISNVILASETEYSFECNTQNARIALMKDNKLIYRTTSDNTGKVTIDLSTLDIAVDDIIELHITAHNRFHYIKTLKIVDEDFKFKVESIFSDELGNNDNILNHGEEILISLMIENIGLQSSTELMAVLTCNNPYITILTEEIMIPDLNPNETAIIDNISISTSSDIKTNICEFYLEYGEGNHNSFYGNIFAPDINLTSTVFSKKTNDKTYINPGDTGKLTITYENAGEYPAKNIEIKVDVCDIYNTITTEYAVIEELGAGESRSVEFEFEIDEQCPSGFISYFEIFFKDEMGKTLENSCATIIGNSAILIVDLDKNKNSMPKLKDDIYQLLGIQCEYSTSLLTIENINDYPILFLSLGIFINNYKLNQEETDILIAYLENGGNLYLESGSLWFYDEDLGLREYFNVIGEALPEAWMNGFTSLVGVEGTFTEGMNFTYNGEDNQRVDAQTPIEPAFQIFYNSPDYFGGATAYDAEKYKVISSSFKHGGLSGDVLPLVTKYLDFFDITSDKPAEIAFGADTTVCKDVQLILDGGADFVSYEWSTGDTERIITVDLSQFENQTFIVVELIAIDTHGYIAKKSIKVNIDDCAGIESFKEINLNLYPNPASNKVYLKFEDEISVNTELYIYNLNGVLISKQKINNNITTIDISNFSDGVYLFKIITPEAIVTKKMIKN